MSLFSCLSINEKFIFENTIYKKVDNNTSIVVDKDGSEYKHLGRKFDPNTEVNKYYHFDY